MIFLYKCECYANLKTIFTQSMYSKTKKRHERKIKTQIGNNETKRNWTEEVEEKKRV